MNTNHWAQWAKNFSNTTVDDEKTLSSDHRQKKWLLSLSLALTFGMGYYI